MNTELAEIQPKSADVIRTGRRVVTPELAKQLLERNFTNRPVSHREVERLKRILEAGQWRMNGEAIKLSKDGGLLDGQHRLIAIVESGVSADVYVISGLDPEVFSTLDQGRKRTGGDVLFTRGIQRYNAVAVACGQLYRLLKNRPIYGSADTIPAYGIADILATHPALEASVAYCAPLHRQGDSQVLGLGQLAAIHYTIDNVLGQPEAAAAFVEGMTLGTGLEEGSPILAFRKRVFDARSSRHIHHAQARMATIAKVVGLWLGGEKVKALHPPAPASASYWGLIPGLKEAVEALDDRQALRLMPY